MTSAQSDRYAFAAQEDRSAPRTKLSLPATFRPSGGRRFQTVVRDLSLSGFSATAITRLPVGGICWLTMPGMEAMQARVVWWEQGMVGCAFERLLSPIIHETILTRWRGASVYEGGQH